MADFTRVLAPTRTMGPDFPATIVDTVRTLTRDLFDPYRPERHYMRGPGPKWHAKHAMQDVAHEAADMTLAQAAA